MYANSSPIVSRQSTVHDQLEKLVAKYAATRFLKPVAPYSEAAFERSIAAWRAAGAPPLILDAGCGTGVSTMNLANQFRDHFVIGVDQSVDRLSRKIAWPGALPTNFITVRADLVDYWRLMQQAGIHPERHYMLYPNPWPKKHHVGRRWHGHPVFPTIVALGGHFECRSNWRIYIEECAAALKQLSAIDIATEAYSPDTRDMLEQHPNHSSPSSSPLTPFEEKYLASGHSLWRCRLHIAPLTRIAITGSPV